MRALVVNCSAPHYNLGAAKCANWLQAEGWDVDTAAGDPGLFAYGHDLVALSVIFSWHAPIARAIALRVRDHADVWAGGPGLLALASWWKRETGGEIVRGLDPRFERAPGAYRMTFASRGCPVGCSFCIVPRLEGLTFSLDWNFTPAPILCDNNLSALPVDFQRHIIRRYEQTGTKLMDANSGFEPRTFDAETLARWRPILRGPWRFAFDEAGEEQWVRPMMQLLGDLPQSRKRVYVLIGNEPMEACYERLRKVVAWGGEPYCQPVMRLNTLEMRPWVRFDWTEQALRDFARYSNRQYWKYCRLGEYMPARRVDEPPFRRFQWAA